MTHDETVTAARATVHLAECELMACGPCDPAGIAAHATLDRALVALSTALLVVTHS